MFETGAEATAGAGTWVLATKPQVLREVCETLSGQARAARPLVVSIAAGITTVQIARWLGDLRLAGEAYVAAQGTALGRSGRVHVRRDGDGIWVGGDVHDCVRGVVRL